MTWSDRFQQMEEGLMQGDFVGVRRILSGLEDRAVPTGYRMKLANVYRRLGMSAKAVKVLGPAVQGYDVPASQAEMIEYCLNLLNLNLYQEVYERLLEMEVSDPAIYLYRASCQVSQWNYQEAIPHLLKYSDSTNGYAKSVGLVNLASAYLFVGEVSECDRILKELLPTCQSQSWNRLLMNCIDVEIQSSIRREDWGRARQGLDEYQKWLTDEESPEYMYWRKADATVRSRGPEGGKPLLELKFLAQQRSQWEIVRSMDHQLVMIGYGNHTADFLFHGTPYRSFREKFLKEYKSTICDHFFMNGARDDIFDLESGTRGGKNVLKPDQSLHRLLRVLTSDFYRPMSVGSIFSQLYPNQFYDPFRSTDKVYRLVSRFRRWAREERVPISVQHKNGMYSLVIQGDMSIRKTFGEMNQRVIQLRSVFGPAEFSARQAAEVLQVSKRFASDLLRVETENGNVARLGHGKNTRYRLVS